MKEQKKRFEARRNSYGKLIRAAPTLTRVKPLRNAFEIFVGLSDRGSRLSWVFDRPLSARPSCRARVPDFHRDAGVLSSRIKGNSRISSGASANRPIACRTTRHHHSTGKVPRWILVRRAEHNCREGLPNVVECREVFWRQRAESPGGKQSRGDAFPVRPESGAQIG